MPTNPALPTLRAVELRGRDYLDAATALLLAARVDDPLAGSYEAGDIQWWWATAKQPAASQGAFWYGPDAGAAPTAALIVTDKPGNGKAGGSIDLDFIRRPAVDATVRAELFPAVAVRFGAFPGRTLRIAADEPDGELRRLLEEAGFRRDPDEDLLQLWQRPAAAPAPAPVPLPAGFRFDDDRSRPADQPHHLVKRNGERVAKQLRETSLYRPDLDLCVRAEDGTVAAYCLCWLHPTTGVGLFEPVRTEDAFQRRGLGRALLTEGIRRLVAAGADLIKVTCEQSNPASRALYERVGFTPAFAMLGYVRP